MSVKQNLFVSGFLHKCLMMLKDVEYTTFKMFVTQMSNYLFVISFQLLFYKTLHNRLARALEQQLLGFFSLSDHVTEMLCHLFKSVQFDFEKGNFRSGFGIQLILSFAIAT